MGTGGCRKGTWGWRLRPPWVERERSRQRPAKIGATLPGLIHGKTGVLQATRMRVGNVAFVMDAACRQPWANAKGELEYVERFSPEEGQEAKEDRDEG